MTPQEFVAKWKRADLSERSAYQQHFLDLCELLNQPKPAAADPDGAWYTFEKGVRKSDGGTGWADVWMRGHFGWEHKRKGKHKTLEVDAWIIDFERRDLSVASKYEGPFEYLKSVVPAERKASHFTGYPIWQLWRPRPEMYDAIGRLKRFAVTPHVAKHRIFAWAEPCICPSNLLIAIATQEDWEFGVLHLRCHEVWSLSLGTQLRERESGFRYTTSTCFETFPFPNPTDAQSQAIAEAARELDRLRTNWLNPPEWTRTEHVRLGINPDRR